MNINEYIRDIPDFPEEWIMFKDITPLLGNPKAFQKTINVMAEAISDCDVIVSLDARGFIFASALAYKLGKPLQIIRKKWKLPAETISQGYDLEYGKNVLEIHRDAIKEGQKVVMVDDVLATGGTMKAACQLVEWLWGVIEKNIFLMKLNFLEWENVLQEYTNISLLEY